MVLTGRIADNRDTGLDDRRDDPGIRNRQAIGATGRRIDGEK